MVWETHQQLEMIYIAQAIDLFFLHHHTLTGLKKLFRNGSPLIHYLSASFFTSKNFPNPWHRKPIFFQGQMLLFTKLYYSANNYMRNWDIAVSYRSQPVPHTQWVSSHTGRQAFVSLCVRTNHQLIQIFCLQHLSFCIVDTLIKKQRPVRFNVKNEPQTVVSGTHSDTWPSANITYLVTKALDALICCVHLLTNTLLTAVIADHRSIMKHCVVSLLKAQRNQYGNQHV